MCNNGFVLQFNIKPFSLGFCKLQVFESWLIRLLSRKEFCFMNFFSAPSAHSDQIFLSGIHLVTNLLFSKIFKWSHEFWTGNLYLLCKFQLLKGIFLCILKSGPSVLLPASLRVKYPSKKRILLRCWNIPLYIFKAFTNHSTGCGFVGKGNCAA